MGKKKQDFSKQLITEGTEQDQAQELTLEYF